jgi:putative nucleotidyltransferase with HDIG domain
MLVHVIADHPASLSDMCALLQREHRLTSSLVSGPADQAKHAEAVVVRVDLRAIRDVLVLKKTLEGARNASKRIFLIENPTRLSVSQAYALGATEVLAGSIAASKLQRALSDASLLGRENREMPGQQPQAVKQAAISLASMFHAVANGTCVDLPSAQRTGAMITDHINEHGLSDWLGTVRRHHEGTYQHCLLVTGIATDFGLSLGFGATDLERLYSAALFHDIGKANIPLAVLDKPGRLNDDERALIEIHPMIGYEALVQQDGISAEILDAIRHHHEYLDGSGYPDGLSGNSISDLVRVLTISDIFAALIEHRPYKQPMQREDAYEVLCGMHHRLEKALVRAFKPVALAR